MEKYSVVDKESGVVLTTLDNLSDVARFANEEKHIVVLTVNIQYVPLPMPDLSKQIIETIRNLSTIRSSQRTISNIDTIETIPFYQIKRVSEYPPLAEQLDTIYHDGIDIWKQQIDAIKEKYPKPVIESDNND